VNRLSVKTDGRSILYSMSVEHVSPSARLNDKVGQAVEDHTGTEINQYLAKVLLKMNKEIIISDEIVHGKIYHIRGQKVMLDRDLAELYGVETKYLKRQVRRNIERFPEDFMFQLEKEELENWRRQIGTSNSSDNLRSQNSTSSWGGTRYASIAFAENEFKNLRV